MKGAREVKRGSTEEHLRNSAAGFSEIFQQQITDGIYGTMDRI
jgi:hypothetical protein